MQSYKTANGYQVPVEKETGKGKGKTVEQPRGKGKGKGTAGGVMDWDGVDRENIKDKGKARGQDVPEGLTFCPKSQTISTEGHSGAYAAAPE